MITNEPSSLLEQVPDSEPGFPGPIVSDLGAQVPDPDNPPWGVLMAALAWAMSIAFLLLVPLLFIVPYIISLAAKSGLPPPEVLATDKIFLFLSILGVIPAHLLTLAVAWAIVTRWGRYPFWETLGMTWPKSFGPWKSIAAGVALFGIGILITALYGGRKTELDALIESSYLTRMVTAFLAVATAPFVEELIHRGILYPALQRAIGAGWAIAIVSLLFAGVHVYQYRTNLGVIAVITLLSVSLTVVRALTGKLLPSFVIHLVFNGIQSLILLIQPFFEKADTVLPNKVPAIDLIQTALRHLI